jgi:hypothetical protein
MKCLLASPKACCCSGYCVWLLHLLLSGLCILLLPHQHSQARASAESAAQQGPMGVRPRRLGPACQVVWAARCGLLRLAMPSMLPAKYCMPSGVRCQCIQQPPAAGLQDCNAAMFGGRPHLAGGGIGTDSRHQVVCPRAPVHQDTTSMTGDMLPQPGMITAFPCKVCWHKPCSISRCSTLLHKALQGVAQQ